MGVSAFAALKASLPPEVAAELMSGQRLLRRSEPQPAPPPDASTGSLGRLPSREVDTSRFPLPLPIPGGLARGTLVEVVGRSSSGRFALALAALASATQMGEAAALVDLGDHLDPQAAEAEGVELARLLWVRPTRLTDALASTELLLGAGFALVVLDLGLAGARRPREAREGEREAQVRRRGRVRLEAAWIRLARRAHAHEAALLVLSSYRVSGTAASIVLTARAARPLWRSAAAETGTSDAGDIARERLVLAGLATRLLVQKERGSRPGAKRDLLLKMNALPEAALLPDVAASADPRRSLLDERDRERLHASAPRGSVFGGAVSATAVTATVTAPVTAKVGRA